MTILDNYVLGERYFALFRQFVIDILSPHFKMKFVDERELHYNLWHSFFHEQFSIDEVCRGGGKAQPMDSLISTPRGFVRMGDIKLNDIVHNANGSLSKVIAIHPQGVKPIYKLTFIDGSIVECCEDHLWKFWESGRKGYKLKDTKHIFERFKFLEGKDNNINIPLCEPVIYNNSKEQSSLFKKLPPYVLGALIGDGCFRNRCTLTNPDDEIINRIKSLINNRVYQSSEIEYSINNMYPILRKLKLFNLKSMNKFIPKEYLYGSIEDRFELIRGLMDTDGTTSKCGKISYSTTSKQLAEDIRFLVKSLGGKATITLKKTNQGLGYAYSVYIQHPNKEKLFHLKRKKDRCRSYNGGVSRLGLRLTNIELIESKECQCITIDNANGLYLTNDFVVTHNSEFIIWLVIYCAVYQPVNKFSGMREKEFLVSSSDNTTTYELNKRISDYFLESDILQHFVPEGIGKKDEKSQRWNKDTLELVNGTKIHFRSIKTKRGLHVDRIVIDDPTTESSTLTDRQTEDFVLGAIIPMGNRKKAIINFTGTPLRETDILNVMSKKEYWVFNKYPLLDEEGNITLPNSFTPESIEQIKSTIGTAKFSAEYLLNPISSEDSLIRYEWVTNCFRPDLSASECEFEEILLCVDFAFSDAITADYSAFADIGVNYNHDGSLKNIIILNIEWKQGLSLNEHWDKIKLKYETNRHDLVVMEENSVRSSVKDIRDLNMPVKFIWMGSKDAVKDSNSNMRAKSISKINAINRLAVMFEYGKIIIPYKTELEKTIADRFLRECISWRLEESKLVEVGVHPDSPIAVVLANEILRSGSRVM